jgi:hypothetical protein
MKHPLAKSLCWIGILTAPLLRALPCTTESHMQPAQRISLSAVILDFAGLAQHGNTAALRARLLSAVASSFDGISNAVLTAAPLLQASQPQIYSLYLLDATTLSPGAEAIFDCTLNSNPLDVTFSLSQLTPGRYLVSFLRFENGPAPQQMLLILGQTGAVQKDWQLGGLFLRPLTLAGHDGVWYWQQGRSYTTVRQMWRAQLSFAAASQLLIPVRIFNSPNLEKLEQEASVATTKDFPGDAPVEIQNGNKKWLLRQAFFSESNSSQPDLTLEYAIDKIAAPKDARADCIALAYTLLAQHAEIRSLFHALQIRAITSSGEQFAIHLEGSDIP